MTTTGPPEAPATTTSRPSVTASCGSVNGRSGPNVPPAQQPPPDQPPDPPPWMTPDPSWQQVTGTPSDKSQDFLSGYIRNNQEIDEKWLADQFGYGGMAGKFPDVETFEKLNINADPTTPVTSFVNAGGENYLENESLRRLMLKYDEAAEALRQMQQTGVQVFQGRDYEEHNADYENLRALLGRYGINFNPMSGTDAPEAGPGGIGSHRDDFNAGNTDVMNKLPHISDIPGRVQQIFGSKWDKADPTERAAMVEQTLQIIMANEQLANKQKGINILQEGYNSTLAENDPLRKESERLSLEALKNPNPVDLQGIQNRTSSRYDQGLDQSIQAMSGSAARRGIGMGAVAGMAGQATRDNRADLARTLGEQESAHQMLDRQSLYDAIANAGRTNATFKGEQLRQSALLANAVRGSYDPATHGYQGAADTAANLKSIDILEKLQAADDKSGLFGGGANVIASILGSA